MKRVFSSILTVITMGFLLMPHARAGTNEDSLVMLAMAGGVDQVRNLLDQGADVNGVSSFLGVTALIGATSMDQTAVVQLLLARGADVNKAGLETTPLTEAAVDGYPDMVRILIDKGADVNKKDNRDETALMKASKILEKGKVDYKLDPIKRRPLTPAETQAYTSVVQMLTAAGAK